MSDERAESVEYVHKWSKATAITIAAFGLITIIVATVWGIYEVIQEGLTPRDLFTIGLVAILLALLLGIIRAELGEDDDEF